MIEIRNLKLVGKVDEVRNKVSKEPKPNISKEDNDNTVNTKTETSYTKKMLGKHRQRNKGGKRGGWVNNY